MKFINNKKLFVINKETYKDYEKLQEIRFKDDMTEHSKYSNNFLFDLVKKCRFQHRLDNYLSIGHKNLLFEFHKFERLTLFQAAARHKEEHLKSIRNNLEEYEFLEINVNGGFSQYIPNDEDILKEYEYISDLVFDNDTMNLVIENDGVIDNELLKLIDSDIQPSHILHYKDIAKNKNINSFIKSRKDWVLWVYTQGMDIDLYKMFLMAYSGHIEEIMVKTTDEVFNRFKDEYPNVNFTRIGN